MVADKNLIFIVVAQIGLELCGRVADPPYFRKTCLNFDRNPSYFESIFLLCPICSCICTSSSVSRPPENPVRERRGARTLGLVLSLMVS